MPTPLTDADKVLRNDTGKDIVTQLTSIASSIATPASLVGLSDTAITTPTDGQELTYNSSLSKWNNKTTRVELTQQQYDLLVANNEDLPDVDYYITDAGGAEVVSSAPNISDVYNPNTTYNTGDLCIYNNVLYKCKTNSVTGAWDGTKWDRTTVDELLAEHEAKINANTTAITNKIGMDMTSLYANSIYVATGGHIDLSEKPSKFRWLLVRFQTNAEFCTQLINTNDTSSSFSQTIMANSTTGQVTYPLSYNATMQAKIDEANQRINIISDFYNNPNYQIRITNVWGVSRK